MPNHPGYPFVAKTTSHVRAGDFWAIPLRRGGWYACGQVLYVPEGRVMLVVGLLDWCEPVPPTAEAIAGAAVLDWNGAHVKTIELTGGPLLGHSPLAGGGWALGYGVWGYLEIENVAHARFGRHFPEAPNPAIEPPQPLRRDLSESP